MTDLSELADPTRIEGAPHPRETARLIGQEDAEAGFLEAYGSGRMHHGWMLTGPRGIGKATLAYRIARFLLATPADGGDGLFGTLPNPDTLDVPPDHPVSRRILAGSEPGLFVLKRGPNDKGDRISAEIRVDEVRKLRNFFALSATEGGRRVVIVDAADELNTNAANAILKLLEEPPSNAFLLLIAHQPSRLLPTIRSRCRELRLHPLAPPEMAQALAAAGTDAQPDQAAALAEIAGGSVGEALRLILRDGLSLYAEIAATLATLPDLDRPRAIRLAERCAGRGAEDRLDLTIFLIDLALARLARTGATGTPPAAEAAPGEAQMLTRLSPTPAAGRAWADLHAIIGDRLRHGRAVNVDPAALILDAFLRMRATAAA